jgi:5-methylcytosine-specific restriction endonuclease McrA
MLIYKNGLSSLLDEHWLLSVFQKSIEHKISKGKTPKELFLKTIQNGLLYLFGSLFFDQMFAISDDVIFCDIKTAYKKSSDVHFLLIGSGVKDSKAMINLLLTIDEVDTIITETPEKRQNSVFHRQGIQYLLSDALINGEEYYENEIKQLKNLYALNYAERVFHDRQFCEYITFAITSIYEDSGFPIYQDELKFTKIKRQSWPTWVKPTLIARERGYCANCGASFSELKAEPQIDHIVPLSQGGSNDLVNLQLLCSKCNFEKHNKKIFVNSSIPKYLNQQRTTKSDINTH